MLCEPWCAEPCSALNGDVRIECGGCAGPWGCHPSATGFTADGQVTSVAVDPVGGAAGKPFKDPVGGTAGKPFKPWPLGAFQLQGWRRCLPPKSDVPHAHDKHHQDFDVRTFDVACLIDQHRAYFGDAFLPRAPIDGLSGLPAAAEGCAGLRGHMAPFGQQRQRIAPVAEFAGCMPSGRFLAEYVRQQRPLVMRGCGRVHPAAQRWATDEYLWRAAADWVPSADDDPLPPLRDWLRSYNRTNDYGARTLHDSRGERPFAARLVDDLVLPPPLMEAAFEVWRQHQLIFWMNAGRRTSALHFDSHDALLTQLGGEKHVLLAPPEASAALYVDFPRAHAEHGEGRWRPAAAGGGYTLDHSRFGYSPIDPHAVDLCTFPQAAGVRLQSVTLAPTDALYVPPVWWHVVASLPRDAPGRTVATTLQGCFLACDIPSTLSAAELIYMLGTARGCTVNASAHATADAATDAAADATADAWEDVGRAPSAEATCRAEANTRADHPPWWHVGRWDSLYRQWRRRPPQPAHAQDGPDGRSAAPSAAASTGAGTRASTGTGGGSTEAGEDMGAWTADGGAWPRWSCVRLRHYTPSERPERPHTGGRGAIAPVEEPLEHVLRSASPLELLQRAFAHDRNESACRTWVKQLPHVTAIRFAEAPAAPAAPEPLGAPEARGRTALVMGLAQGGAVYAGSAAGAPFGEAGLVSANQTSSGDAGLISAHRRSSAPAAAGVLLDCTPSFGAFLELLHHSLEDAELWRRPEGLFWRAEAFFDRGALVRLAAPMSADHTEARRVEAQRAGTAEAGAAAGAEAHPSDVDDTVWGCLQQTDGKRLGAARTSAAAGADLDNVLRQAQADHECTRQLGIAALAQLERMLFGFWGTVLEG